MRERKSEPGTEPGAAPTHDETFTNCATFTKMNVSVNLGKNVWKR